MALLFLWLLTLSVASQAGEIRALKLDLDKDGSYLIESELLVNGSQKQIERLLTDYAHLTRLNSQVLESELISVSKDEVSLVRTKVHLCGYLFCKTINQVQRLKRVKNGGIVATIVPEQSDFLKGRAEWSFQPEGDSVLIHFNAQLLPRFWTPPLINLWVMQRMLENEMKETILNLEKLQPK